MSDTNNTSAQVNMLKKMREEYSNGSTLDKLVSQVKREKNQTQINKITQSTTAQPNAEDILIKVSPSICRPWVYADRNSLEMGSIEDLANSIKANGQQEPALVRKLSSPDKGIEYEVIFGHRRWLACTLCDQPLLAIVKQLSNKEAAIAQKEENENRENLSDYARAVNYSNLLKDKVFSSESELAANFGIKRTSLADILAYVKIPNEFMRLIQSPHKLPKRVAVRIAQICKNISTDELEKICQYAALIEKGKIPFNKLNKDLLLSDCAENNQLSSKKDVKIFKNSLSVNLFKSGKNQNNTPCFTFHKIVTDNNLISEIEDLVYNFLKEKTES